MKYVGRFLLLMGLSVSLSPLAAATPAEDALTVFLHKKYNKAGRILDKIIPNTPTDHATNYEGRRTDGSYWWGPYFNRMNASVVGQPRKALEKYCTETGGILTQSLAARVFDNGEGRATLRDPAGGADFHITNQILERWRRTSLDDVLPTSGPRSWSDTSPAAFIDNRNLLGIFYVYASKHNDQ